jgi:hypothetical protein
VRNFHGEIAAHKYFEPGIDRRRWPVGGVSGRDNRHDQRAAVSSVPHGDPEEATTEAASPRGQDDLSAFQPPPGTRPALVGVLLDGADYPVHLAATVVDLAVRGYLVIEQAGGGEWRFVRRPQPGDGPPPRKRLQPGKRAFRRRRRAPANAVSATSPTPRPPANAVSAASPTPRASPASKPPLLAYERTLLQALWNRAHDGKVELLELSLEHAQFHTAQLQLNEEVMDRRWFRRRPDGVRRLGRALCAGAAWFTVAGLMVPAAWMDNDRALQKLLLLFSMMALAALVVFSAEAFDRWLRSDRARGQRRVLQAPVTAEGQAALEEALDFGRLVEEADGQSLQGDRAERFVDALPYAMVFGLADQWARVLSTLVDRGGPPLPAWYRGEPLWGFHPESGTSLASELTGAMGRELVSRRSFVIPHSSGPWPPTGWP